MKSVGNFCIRPMNDLMEETNRERIGYWIDMDNPYITLDNDYIETVWWILKTVL